MRHSLTSGGAASSTRGERQAHGQEAARGVEGGGLENGPSLQQVYHSGGGDAGWECRTGMQDGNMLFIMGKICKELVGRRKNGKSSNYILTLHVI